MPTTKEEMMIRILKKVLLLPALFAVFAVAQAGTVSAQVTIASADDIPLETTRGGAQAYYESATGNVYFSLGTELLIATISNVQDQLIFENFDNSTPLGGGNPATITEIVFLSLPGSGFPLAFSEDVRIFNLGAILPADPSITDVASFQASPFGDAQLQFSTGGPDAIQGFNDFNVIAVAVPEPSSFSLLVLAGLSVVARRRR